MNSALNQGIVPCWRRGALVAALAVAASWSWASRANAAEGVPADGTEPSGAEQSAAPEPSNPPRTAGALQLGAGFRYGVAMDDPVVDPWKRGLGLTFGYTTYSGLYVGGVFDYFLGETRTVLGVDVSANVWQVGGEVGYDFMLGDNVMLRPKASAGVSTTRVRCSPQCQSSPDESYFGVAPGATAMLYAGRVTFALDARYQLVFADPEMAKALILSFGIGF